MLENSKRVRRKMRSNGYFIYSFSGGPLFQSLVFRVTCFLSMVVSYSDIVYLINSLIGMSASSLKSEEGGPSKLLKEPSYLCHPQN